MNLDTFARVAGTTKVPHPFSYLLYDVTVLETKLYRSVSVSITVYNYHTYYLFIQDAVT